MKKIALFTLFIFLCVCTVSFGESNVVIEPTTLAKTYTLNIPSTMNNIVIQVDSTIGAEVITIEQLDTDGSWNPIKVGGNSQTLSADTTQLLVTGVNMIRINKPVTVGSIGIKVISDKVLE